MIMLKGWRKTALILGFLLPTLLGVIIFSLYPVLFNVYISFTNRSLVRYRPPESLLTCSPSDMGTYCWNAPLLDNYTRLFGPLLTGASLGAWARLALLTLPWVGVYVLTRRNRDRTMTAAVTWWVWPLAVLCSYGIWYLAGAQHAIQHLMDSGDFFIVMFRTFLYVALCLPFFILTGGVLALILSNDHIKAKSFFRTTLILPWAVPSYITAKIWQFFFRTEHGTINQLLRTFNIQGPAWLQTDALAFGAVVLINVWLSYPFFMTVIMGGLQTISRDLYEAAEVDGASWWQQLSRITIPMLRPAVMPAIVLSAITTFQMFNTVWLVTDRGGPARGAGKPGATEFVMLYAYKQFRSQNYGAIAAFSVVVFLLLFGATLLSLRLTRITKGAYE